MKVVLEKMTNTDRYEFKKVFDDFYQTLCVFAATFLKDNTLAADVVQETFVGLWEQYENFDNIHKIKGYLYTVVRHKCLNIIRDKEDFVREDELRMLEEVTIFNDILIERESYRIFYNAVDALPPQSRKIIYLAIDGLKNAEIAAELNIAETTVHRLKKLAYKKLRLLLKDYFYLIFVFVP